MSTPKKITKVTKKSAPKKKAVRALAVAAEETAEDMSVPPLVDLMMQYRELEAMTPDPDEVAPAEYLCKYGHLTLGDFRFSVTTPYQGMLADSGPMCPVCIIKHIGHKFGVRRLSQGRRAN